MRRVLLAIALIASVVTAVAGAVVVPPRIAVFGPATELGRGPLAWRIDAVTPGSPAAAAGLVSGDVVKLRSPYADYRYRAAHDPIAVLRNGASLVVVAGDAVVPNATAWRVLLRLLRLITHLAMCALAAIVLWRRYDNAAARALAWFLVAFGFSLSFDASWFTHGWGAAANIALDVVIGAMLVAATRFAASIGDVDAPVRATLANVSVAVGIVMVGAVSALLALQYAGNWNEPELLAVWWIGWAVQLTLTLATLTIGYARAAGTERRRLAYVVITFAVGFSGPIVATFGLAVTGSAAGTPLYESLVAWRLTSIAIPIGFGYAVLFHHLLDIQFVVSRAMVYGLISSGLVPLFAVIRIIADKLAGKNIGTSSLISTIVTVGLLAFFEPLQKGVRHFLDATVFRARTSELKGLENTAKDLYVLSDASVVLGRVIDGVKKYAAASGAAIYAGDGRTGYSVLASDLTGAPDRLDPDALEVARVRRTKEGLQPAGGAFGAAALALPLIVRGAITGFVALGPKADGQHYAPDEIEALSGVAASTAATLEALAFAAREDELVTLRAVRDEVTRALGASAVSAHVDRSGGAVVVHAADDARSS